MIGNLTLIGSSKEERLMLDEVEQLFVFCLATSELGTQARPATPIFWNREPMDLNCGRWTN